MKLFAGIDGGQSSTAAVVGDETGRALARGTAGPADEVAQGPGSTRLRDALRGALADALARAGLPADSRFESVVAGVSGYDGKVYGQPPELAAERFVLVHDTAIAHAGALGGEPGVIVIAGTGSVAYARGESGREALAGGWGYLFGDEGSAFWLAREALSGAMREADAGRTSELYAAIAEHFSQPSLRALVRAFYAGGISRAEVAAFAPVLLRCARAGNERAAQLVREGAAALASLAEHAARSAGLQTPQVALLGGLLNDGLYAGEIERAMTRTLPQARWVRPQRDAAEGALLLAYRPA